MEKMDDDLPIVAPTEEVEEEEQVSEDKEDFECDDCGEIVPSDQKVECECGATLCSACYDEEHAGVCDESEKEEYSDEFDD